MGTRGIVGFILDKKYHGTYNYYDSYPSGLGCDLADVIKIHILGKDIEEIKNRFRTLNFVEGQDFPTASQRFRYRNSTENVGNNPGQDWYSVLRSFQGAFGIKSIIMGGLKEWIVNDDFIMNGLFCEWGYILDLDKEEFIVYRGFQKESPPTDKCIYPKRERKIRTDIINVSKYHEFHSIISFSV